MKASTKKQLNDIINEVGIAKTEKILSLLAENWFVNNEIRWDDLRFPAQAINPPGAVSDPDRDTTDGTLLFDAGSTEIIMGAAQLPHAWSVGSAIHPHIHWHVGTAATGNVVWKLESKVFGKDEEIPADWTELTMTVAAAKTQTLSSFDEIDLTGKGISTMMLWRLSRIGGDIADTYIGDAKLFEFDIHYQIDGFGSEEEYIKY